MLGVSQWLVTDALTCKTAAPATSPAEELFTPVLTELSDTELIRRYCLVRAGILCHRASEGSLAVS
ncbi:hypothetical protein E2C01_068279 [Portunus trituberculatus]|uniref:Uncharacterized protein n=1 Tax=Portunus trituberculatus TaxID=210409 RepID=A0A5B7HW32_PORTR|nr:hypothetical protein [Portunus trituberculatus]